MKHFLLFLALLIAGEVCSQEKAAADHQILEDVRISLEMGSLEDLNILDSEDLTSLFDYAKPDQPIELKIICNFDYKVEDLTISGTTLKISGNTNALDEFNEKARKAQSALKKLYNTKG